MSFEWDEPDLATAASRALRAGAQLLRQESDRVAPREDGDLSASAMVVAEGMSAAVGYGSPYAIKQHENLHYSHPSGGVPKYLETALINQQQAITSRIGERLLRELGGP